MNPYILIKLDRYYKFRLTFAGIVEYEQLTGLKFAEFNTSDSKCLENLLFVLMERESPNLTPETAAKAIEGQEIEAFKAAIQAVTEACHSESDEPQEAPTDFEYADYSQQVAFAMAEFGMKADEFWDLTPAEYSLILKKTAEHRRQEHNDRITQAWHAGLFSRMGSGKGGKKMLPLKDYLQDIETPKSKKREMTDDQMMNACKMLCLSHGGKVIRKKAGKEEVVS